MVFKLWSDSCLGQLPELAKNFQRRWQPLSLELPKRGENSALSDAEKLTWLRRHKIGRLTMIPAPELWAAIDSKCSEKSWRAMLHLDYTASAQGLSSLEHYIQECLCTYANTHTETSTTGKHSTQRFHQAIDSIRRHVNAGQDSFVVPSGYGATGAIEKIQKIMGLYLSPKGQRLVQDKLGIDLKSLMAKKVVVFVGPFEHHSNDVSWQDAALCHFVRIKAIRSGPSMNDVDLADLEQKLKEYDGYIKIGSFSAASNVTGIKTNLKALSELLHRYNALCFVDYAACSPYADIDMERDGIDALYLSVHKNLGGANVGFLVGRRHIYDRAVHPSFGGGGTVAAVTPWEYHFHESIEERESAGTQAIRQTWQAALSFEIKDWIGRKTIHKLEQRLTDSMVGFFRKHPRLQLLGNLDPALRYPIFSFLVHHGQRKLHHTFVAVLFNDFFGIQARSGCACAGPFGHELLHIEREQSSKYVELILNILNGFKPGWTRIGMHYTLSDTELAYTQKALSAIAWFGPLFLMHYSFDPYTGDWVHQHANRDPIQFGLEEALGLADGQSLLPRLKNEEELYRAFQNQLEEFYLLSSLQLARLLADDLPKPVGGGELDRLAAGFYPILRRQVEERILDEKPLLEALLEHACKVLITPGQETADCRLRVRGAIEGLLTKPETQLHRYEDFAGIDPGIPFFYVVKGRLTEEIQLGEHDEDMHDCPSCSVR